MTNYTLIIGNKNYSSWSWRAWLALKQTQVAFKEVLIPLDAAETAAAIAKHSPSGRVPALLDGARAIWDSLAIAEYLAEQHPNAGLWPRDVDARAFARSISAEMHSGFSALRTQCTMDCKGRKPGKGLDAPGVAADIARIIAIWTEARGRFGTSGPFLCGEYSLADAFYTPVVSRFVTYGVTLQGAARDYAEKVWEHPFTREWRTAAEAETMRMARYDR